MNDSIIVYKSKSEQMMDERNAQFIKDHPDLAYGVQLGFGVFVIGLIAFAFINLFINIVKKS